MRTDRPLSDPRRCILLPLSVPVLALVLGGCGNAAPVGWGGSVDTLASGQVVVTNPDFPAWSPEETWGLVEELRIGTMTGDGADLFGQIRSLAVDDAGRLYVLEGQAQEVRVFGPDGAHIRTIGRKGGGPGEFAGALQAEIGPDGNLWVVDPQNNRLSVFDTAGAYVEGHSIAGGIMIVPWPGGFDASGAYYYPVPRPSDGEFRMALAKYDAAIQPVDTLEIPRDPEERDYFELRREGSFLRAAIPYSAGFRWRLSPEGTLWGVLTGEYRMFELSQSGDTLRSITRDYAPVPVTEADMDAARERMSWFTRQGGEVDWGKVPDHKPAVNTLHVDDDGNIWVWPVTEDEEGLRLDVFDRVGRYLGRVTSPVPVADRPAPVFRDGTIYAVTESELDVPYVVRLRIER